MADDKEAPMSRQPIPGRVGTFTEEEYQQRVKGKPGANRVFRCEGALCGEGIHYHLAETVGWAMLTDRQVVKYRVPPGFETFKGQL